MSFAVYIYIYSLAKNGQPGVTKGWCLVPSSEWIIGTPILQEAPLCDSTAGVIIHF